MTSLVDLEEQYCQCVLADTVVSGQFGGTLAPIPTWKEVGKQHHVIYQMRFPDLLMSLAVPVQYPQARSCASQLNFKLE